MDIVGIGKTILAGIFIFIAVLLVLYYVVYAVTSAFYDAQTKSKHMGRVLHDFNLSFPPGLALLFKEWIEEYRTMSDQARAARPPKAKKSQEHTAGWQDKVTKK